MLLLNGSAALLAVSFIRILPADLQLRRFVKSAAILQVGMNILAMICNVCGRLSLVQVLGITAIFAFTQAMGLSALVKIAIEALLLQINTSRLKRSFESTFEFTTIVQHFKRPLLFVVVLMWLVVFTTNLNLYDALFEGAIRLLHAPRSIGNISFSFGSILLFFLIIWLAHFLQRYLAYFLGDVGDDESEGLAHRSKLLMTRLVLLGAGYLLAVAASGLPVDRITIVLGALGVGIGLGLQNIVNNFVSGIILIFDRPLKVGDTIEVGSHAGRVKEIGLRSSTLATVDGADVIIPNGDMLSQHIVNWTYSNDYKRIDMLVTVNTNDDKEVVIAIIKEIIRSEERVLKKREPVILLDSIKDNELKLKVFFWCDDVYKAEQTESEVRYSLYNEFRAKGITVS
jgi:potassium-dependent mechanosensitive channel